MSATVILLLVAFCVTWSQVYSACDSYGTRCTIQVGDVIQEGGQPVVLSAHRSFYISFTPPTSASFVDIDLSIFYGSLQIFVAKGREPKLTDFDVCTFNNGESDFLRVVYSSAAEKQMATNVMLYADMGVTLFSGAVIEKSVTAKILSGIPLMLHVEKGTQMKLKGDVHSKNTSVLACTAFAGTNPTMALTLQGSGGHVQGNHGLLKFEGQRSDIGKTFEIVLTAVNNSVTSISYGESVRSDLFPIRLQDGLSQHDLVEVRTSRYYIFSVPPALQDQILITVDPLQGDADLFVNPPSRGFYHRGSGDPFAVWSSARPTGSDSVMIDSSDSNTVQSGGNYYISVYGQSYAEYVVRVSLSNTVTTLVEGASLMGTLKRGHYHYYRFYDRSPTQSLFFDVLPNYGDADIMVGCCSRPTGDDSGFPSKISGHYNFSSMDFWEDSIEIQPMDAHRCRGSTGGAIYYVAVAAFFDTSYTITAMHEGGVRMLTPGIVISGNILSHMSQFYEIHSSFETKSLTVQLSPEYGDCDLYVKIKGMVSLNSYDFKSINIGRATDLVRIPETKMCSNCRISVLVYSISSSAYTLVASFSDDTISVMNAVPLRGSVGQGEIQYYYYTTSSTNSKVTAVLTLLSGSDGMVYISSQSSTPNATSSNTIASVENDVVPTVSITNNVLNRIIYIGVGGSNASYMLRVHEQSQDPEDPVTLLTLLEGVPQNDAVRYQITSDWVYYGLQMPVGHETINIRASPLVGNMDIYVRKCTRSSLYQCAKLNLPSTSNYTLTTAEQESDIVSVYRNDIVDTLYIIGAYGTSYYSAYQMSFSIGNSVLELQAGVAIMDHVAVGEFDYFSFFFDAGAGSVKFSLTTASGDPDMYISTTNHFPTALNSTWRSERFGSDTIEIDPSNDSKGRYHSTYYVSVVGLSESTYTLLVTVQTSQAQLQDGIQQSGSVDMFGWTFYQFPNGYGNTRNFKLSLTSISGNADIYVTTDGTLPSLNNFVYSSTHWFTTDEIIIHHNDPQYSPCLVATGLTCTIKIGVYGVLRSSFTIAMVSNSTASLLQLGVPTLGSVAADDYTLYKVLPSQQSTLRQYTLRFAITPYSGHTSLYVSCFANRANKLDYGWILSPALTGSTLDIGSLSFQDKGCLQTSPAFYASVFGDTASSFSIIASVVNNQAVSQLIPNLAASSTVGYNHINYYYVNPTAKYEDLRLLLTVLQGDVDLYLSSTWDSRPFIQDNIVTSYVMKSSNVGSEDITLNHDIFQDLCNSRQSCYIVVAVVGVFSGVATSTYTLLASPQDSTIMLSNGIPCYGEVKQRRTEYYMFSLLQVGVDVSISLSALSGDPDLFIGLGAYKHPNPSNYTYAHMNVGEDDLTLQYDDLTKYCVPNPALGRRCDIYIGVFGWSNSTYSITAHTEDGFLSPSLLLDGNPVSGHVKSGSYIYYKYLVSVSQPGTDHPSSTPMDIKFIMTPTDGADIDLYIKFSNNSASPDNEPGRGNYDYKSIGWSSVAESIEVSYDMPHYCLNCVIYIAVFGYAEGSYTIQASSTGVMTLQTNSAAGGHVDHDKFTYYSFYNPNQFAEISITLTAVSGDADLYVTKRTVEDGSKYILPSKSNYIWRGLSYGSDNVRIDYDDGDYCYNCEYVVGVYGFSNATYTILLSNSEASVIRLVSNRPQSLMLQAHEKQYFSSVITSSLADVTITLTSLNTGYADVYAVVYNTSYFNSLPSIDNLMPDPNNPRTYQFTSSHTEDSHVFIPGPHSEECTVLITVVALSTVNFLITATSTSSPVLLLSGIPQSHFVNTGQNELFVFYPDVDEDLKISVQARSGDPDLFASSQFVNPLCTSGSNPWDVRCSNYTWTSRMYYSDQIVISNDAPCSPVLNNVLVDASCDPNLAYQPAQHKPVYIDVYGYTASKFTILASPTGLTASLLAGQPQSSITTPAFICDKRTESTGACAPSSQQKKVQISYFSFRVTKMTPPPNVIDQSSMYNVLLTIIPYCNSSFSNTTATQSSSCSPGCACNPLRAFVTSCLEDACMARDRKPSELSGFMKVLSLSVQSDSGSTLMISRGTAAYCDPHNSDKDCLYFIGVEHSNVDQAATFSVTARTPGDISLIPCDGKSYPDGIRVRREDQLYGSSGLYYEVCSQQSADSKGTNTVAETMLLELEQCFGSTALYACADDNHCATVLPSTKSYGYYADISKTCTHSWTSSRDTCTTSYDNKLVRMSLPPRQGNYFLLTNGTGKYNLKIQNTVKGLDMSPRVVPAGSSDLAGVSLVSITGNSVTLQWRQSRVVFPGLASSVIADFMSYTAYIFDKAALTKVKDSFSFSSACGLDIAADILKRSELLVIPAALSLLDQGNDYMTHLFKGLQTNKEYKVVIVATCDGTCLRQVSKTLGNPRVLMSCSFGEDCKTQTFIYSSLDVKTDSKTDKDAVNDDDDSGGTSTGSLVATSAVIIVAIILVILGIATYWYKKQQELEPSESGQSSHGLSELIDMRFFGGLGRGGTPSSSSTSSNGTSSYDPPGSGAHSGWENVQNVLGSIKSSASALGSKVKEGVVQVAQRARGAPLAQTEMQPASMDSSGHAVPMNSSWIATKPVWATGPVGGNKKGTGYAPLGRGRGASQFTLEDDEDIEVSL